MRQGRGRRCLGATADAFLAATTGLPTKSA